MGAPAEAEEAAMVRDNADRRFRRPTLEQLEPRLLLDGTPAEQTVQLFNVSPALFVENQGQWADDSIKYAFQGSGASVLFTDTGPVFQLLMQEAAQEAEGSENGPPDASEFPRDLLAEAQDDITHSTQFSVHFDGANAVSPIGLEQAETVFNYFIGDQARWRSDVPAYETVAYEDLYDGIDLHTWGRRDSLKYEFRVASGADYRRIQVSYDGIESLSIDGNGAIHVQTQLGELIDDAPYVYQDINGRRVEVAGAFELLSSSAYTFSITGEYDFGAELIIDPQLAWSTYLGGSDDDLGRGTAVDDAGNVYVTGWTGSSVWVSGGFDESYNGARDAFVAKLSPTGGHLWSTYLGGSEHEYGYDIAVDGAGNAYVTGWTDSSGWVSGGFDESYNGARDAFVAKLSPTGDHVWSTYLGGGDRDNGYSIDVDANGNAYVTGETMSSGWVSGGFDATHDGGWDAFVAKLSPTGSHLWSAYLGSGDRDFGSGIAVDGAGNAYVTGGTRSSAWVSGGFDTTHNGGWDAFAVKLNPTGGHLWSTYLGAGDWDQGIGIAVDGGGNVHVTGGTRSNGWVSGGFDTTHNGGWDAFIVKLSPTGDHLWSTYLGGADYDYGLDIAVDGADNAYVTGETMSSGWVSGGFDTSLDGVSDAFAVALSPAGDHSWSTYLGGDDEDGGYGIAVDGEGNALVTGETWSSGWVSGGFDTSYNGGGDVFVAKILIRLMGDVNSSGYVDDDDHSVMRANWGTGDEWGEGDLNENGAADDDDLSLLLANWNRGTPPAPSGQAASLAGAYRFSRSYQPFNSAWKRSGAYGLEATLMEGSSHAFRSYRTTGARDLTLGLVWPSSSLLPGFFIPNGHSCADRFQSNPYVLRGSIGSRGPRPGMSYILSVLEIGQALSRIPGGVDLSVTFAEEGQEVLEGIVAAW